MYTRSVSFLRRAAAVSTILFLLPTSVGAKSSSFLTTQDDAAVTRGTFIRAVVKTLNLPLSTSKHRLTQRVPSTLAAFVRTAEEKGALDIFGKDWGITTPITRGQALVVLVKLTGATSTRDDNDFTDVKMGSPYFKAVQVAIEKGWMKPKSEETFGVMQTLMGAEGKMLLAKLGRGPGAKPTTVPTIKINLNGVKPSTTNQQILQQVWNLLQDNFLYNDRLDSTEATYKAAEGLVNSLKDPYTVFLRPISAQNFQNQIQGEVTGIGAQVEQKAGVLTIVTPLTGSPAEKAGLKSGDEVLSVDGVTLDGLSFEDAVAKIRGPKGTSAKLHIRRDGNELDVTVTRDTIHIPEVDVTYQGDIAVVRLLQFGQTTNDKLRGVMQDIAKQKPKGLILDLRNNPGGLLHAAEEVISNFVPKGSIFASIHARDSVEQDITENEPTIDPSVKIAVLVNKGSASASEIVAGALQDAKRATIIGELTYGKGTVQQLTQLSDGSTLKMTIAEWKTPSGRKIDGVGIEPDIKVTNGGERDDVMLKALDILR